MPTTSNIFSNIPSTIAEEIFEAIVTTGELNIERIISKGHVSPKDFWYDQPSSEWVMVLQGRAKLRFCENDDVIELNPGDHLDIPPMSNIGLNGQILTKKRFGWRFIIKPESLNRPPE